MRETQIGPVSKRSSSTGSALKRWRVEIYSGEVTVAAKLQQWQVSAARDNNPFNEVLLGTGVVLPSSSVGARDRGLVRAADKRGLCVGPEKQQ